MEFFNRVQEVNGEGASLLGPDQESINNRLRSSVS